MVETSVVCDGRCIYKGMVLRYSQWNKKLHTKTEREELGSQIQSLSLNQIKQRKSRYRLTDPFG